MQGMPSVKAKNMNRKQKIVLWAGVIIITGMLIYPPWSRNIQINSDGVRYEKYIPLGCSWLWYHPFDGSYRANIDTSYLPIEIAIVVIVCIASILTLKGRRTKNDHGDTERQKL